MSETGQQPGHRWFAAAYDAMSRSGERRTLGKMRREHVRAGGVGGRVQDIIQPAWTWFGAGCHPNRRTEASIRAAGFEIEQIARGRMNGVLPIIHGMARAPA